MSLHWLAPAAASLLGLALLPILVHLIRQPPQKRRLFGAMMLLRRMEIHSKKRSRIQDLLLLLLRILMLLCLGLAIAQPEFRWPDPNQKHERAPLVSIIIDNSLSMNQKMGKGEELSALDSAKQQAIEFVKELPDEISIAVHTGDAVVQSHDFSSDKSLALAALSAIEQSEGRGDLPAALAESRRLFDGRGGELFLYTDEAGVGLFDGIAHELQMMIDQQISVIPLPVRPKESRNLVVESAEYGEGVEGGTVRFSIMNYGTEAVEAISTVSLPDGTEIRTFVNALPLQQTQSFVTVPRVMEGGIGKIAIEDSALLLDNNHFFHLPRIGASRILVVDGDPGVTSVASEVYFLERALSPWDSGGRDAGLQPDVVGEYGFNILNPEEHRVVFVANIGEPSAMAGRLIEFVRNGGGVVLTLGSNVSPERINAALSELLPSDIRRVEELTTLSDLGMATVMPDPTHPIFSPFIRGGIEEFPKILWTKVFSMEGFTESNDVSVLLKLENGFPLLIEKKVGKGRVILLTSSIDMEWGNFPLRSIYMPLIQRMVGYLGASASSGLRHSAEVGEPISISMGAPSEHLIWNGPKGSSSASLRDGKVWLNQTHSGAYRLSVEGGPALAFVSLNTPLIESDVRVEKEILASAAEISPEQFIKKVALAPWLLLIAICFFMVQAFVSAVLSTRKEETMHE